MCVVRLLVARAAALSLIATGAARADDHRSRPIMQFMKDVGIAGAE
jgi:hypothetical protein